MVTMLAISQFKSQSYLSIEKIDWESMEVYIGLKGINEIHHQSQRTFFDQEFEFVYSRLVNNFIHRAKQALVYLIDDFNYVI